MSLHHKHRMLVRPFTRKDINAIFFACSECGYMAWFAKAYFYNTIWKEGIRDD